MLLYVLMRVCSALVRVLPSWLVYLVAVAAGEGFYWLWRKKRRIALQNMAQVLGLPADHPEVKRAARCSMRNYMKYLAEFLRLQHLSADEIAGAVRHVQGWEHLEEALTHGKGVIFVSGHFGNWDVGAAFLARNFNVTVVADTFRPPRLNELVQGIRRHTGIQVIGVDGAARKLFRALRQNQIVGLLIDRPVDSSGVEVTFFGQRTNMPAGAAALALKTGAVVVPMGMWRNCDNSYSGMIAPPIVPVSTGNFDRDVQALMQKIVHGLEEIIRLHPDQWYMFRPMWPRTPAQPAARGMLEAPGPAARPEAGTGLA
jgi:lauroyl/myristoyl acyltransferase